MRYEEEKRRNPKPVQTDSYHLRKYSDFLTNRAREQFDLSKPQGKVEAINFLMPYVQRLSDRLLRSEWATRIASELRVDEPVLREALRRAAVERRSEVKPKAELLGAPVRPAERRLMQMLMETEATLPDGQDFREKLAHALAEEALHRGLETERIFEALLSKAGDGASPGGGRPDAATLAAALEERDRRMLFEILFEPSVEATWEEAESCLGVLRSRAVEQELADLQKKIESKAPPEELNQLLARRLELQRILARR